MEAKRVEVRLSGELHAAALNISQQLGGMSINAVMNMALASYVRNWVPPWKKKGKKGQEETYGSGWLKSRECPGCHKKHDPVEHGSEEYGATARIRISFEEKGLAIPVGW